MLLKVMMMKTKQRWTSVVSQPAHLVIPEYVIHLHHSHLPLSRQLARKCLAISNLLTKPSGGHIVKAVTHLLPSVVEAKQNRIFLDSEKGTLTKL